MRSVFRLVLSAIFLIALLLGFASCGGSGNGSAPPLAPTFTSTPPTSAEEGMAYSYLVTATSPNGGTVSFTLTTAPTGATMSGNTISWNPTHEQSRTANSFLLSAADTAGGNATQSWSVTPNGTVNITAVTTYWTASGTTNQLPPWPADLPYPAALVPQPTGTLQRLQGSANSDGSFSIPNVPGGYYWLQINPNSNFWTSVSDFDDGFDVTGSPPAITSGLFSTVFDYSISGLQPSLQLGGYVLAETDFSVPAFLWVSTVPPGATTLTSSERVNTNLDWSKVTTLYLSQNESSTSGNFAGWVLGPAQTLSNVSLNNGATNTITATLAPSPSASVALQIAGAAWASAAQGTAPFAVTPVASPYAILVQPYVADRYAVRTPGETPSPTFTLLTPEVQGVGDFLGPPTGNCELSTEPFTSPLLAEPAPIASNTDYGTISYGDPYPASWLRMLQYCQISTVDLPRPNANTTDTFTVVTEQTTALPTGPVEPILGAVQAPTLNGASLYQSATLNTTNVTISWMPPTVGQPYGYFVSVYGLTTTSSGETIYAAAGRYGTAKTSLTIPFISAGNTYVFTIIAASDAKANMEKAPHRFMIPSAQAGVVSAPFVISPDATQ